MGAGSEHFSKLLSRHCALEIVEIPEVKRSPDGSIDSLKNKEAERIVSQLKARRLWCLDRTGSELSSEDFAAALGKVRDEGAPALEIVIGGAFGLGNEALKRADRVLSLSQLTFSHQLARLIILEQLYRGFSILAGTPYHK